MHLSQSKLGKRAVSAITLFCFTLTTLSPSLAWAAQARDEDVTLARSRVVDEVSAKDLAIEEPGRDRAATAVEDARDAAVRRDAIKPSKDELKDAVTSGVEQRPDGNAVVNTSTAQVTALPTGGDKSGVTSQSISVPKGAGTIQGMGESFSAQLSTGIATFTVPFSLPAARGGAQPSLGLSYSSSSGAGLAGMGWSVGVPYIARQTDRGLPTYDDQADWHPNQDRFVFNGGQELVPICLVGAGGACTGKLTGEVMPTWAAGYQYFRPRVEGSFLRFFWSGDHRTWRVEDKSGVTMELGVALDGRGDQSGLEVDPNSSKRIFRWHLARQYDTYGASNPLTSLNPAPYNVVVYKYLSDGGQAYLSDIYDTTPPTAPADTATLGAFAHHTHLEYESRTDPTETYHSGWRIQQNLRLKRVDVTSKTFYGRAAERQLVRRYHLEYDGRFHTSYLSSVQVEGRCAAAEGGSGAKLEAGGLIGSTQCEKLPPMTFDYQHVSGFTTAGSAVQSQLDGYEPFDARIQQVGGDPPHSIDEELSDFFDTNADGLPDLLVTAPGVYGNDYGVFRNSDGGTRDTFGNVRKLGVVGVLGANSGTIKLSNANVMPLDLDADGIVDLVHMPKVKTYSVYHFLGDKLVGTAIDVANQQNPKVDLGKDAAETKIADVNFDGLVDVVVSTGTEFQTFLSLGRLPKGYAQFGHGNWATSTAANISNDPVRKCVPYSGTPVRFSDSDIQLADMNGDGIQDIVRLRRGDLRYWPGRGNGFWGTGKLDDCPAGSFGDKRYLTMDSAPYYSDIEGTSLRLDDVNGDGLDDLVQVRFDAVDVWLNVDGRGWTQRYIIDGTVPSPSFANRVRLMDINGSGTRDIVWGNGKKYEYLDLAGGKRPGLLIQVRNGLGKSTDIEYGTSTDEMLAAERTGVDCAGDTGPFESRWCSKMPTVAHVVKRVTESDNLGGLGLGASQYVTAYSYRDPVYDGRQREFRGFRRARSKRIGDENSPTDLTESTFLLGECEDETPSDSVANCAQTELYRDNPREALKGLPVVTERFNEAGVRLSTALTTYRLRQLYLGRDERAVRHAFQSSSKTYSYDTAAPGTAQVGSEPFKAAELERTAGAAVDDSAARLQAFTHYLTSGTAIVESSADVDVFGNATTSVARGCTGGGACPTADEVIYKYTQPKLLGDWMFRTERSYATGSVHTQVRGETNVSYDDRGAPISTKANLSGSVGLYRAHELAGRAYAGAPVTASANGWRVLGRKIYDKYGNVVQETGPIGDDTNAGTRTDLHRCRQVTYDTDIGYAQLPLAETIYPGGCSEASPPVPGAGTALMTSAIYDRALGLVTQVTDLNLKSSTVDYDQFGRLVQLTRPPGTAPAQGATPLASVTIDYTLPSPQNQRAYSVIHTRTQSGATEMTNLYAEAYSFVDGMGRARVGLSQGDKETDWIVSSVAEFDAKGAVRRKYLPFFFSEGGNPSVFPLTGPPHSQYGRQRYDAFGRQLQTFDVDGTVTLQSRYHALSTDLFDAADLYPGPHQGSYASTRTDGHGRTVETTERVHVNGALESRYVRTQYLVTGEPEVISRVRGNDAVTRWMRYDSLGRLVLNVEPHTSVNFTTDVNANADPVTGTLKAWRYVYNDAGDLVGTSDARGCGQNFYYDGAGRLFGEDYSPCLKAHPLYTPPASNATNPGVPTSSDGFEVFYQFDASSSSSGAAPPDFRTTNLQGRLVAVHDRAATTWFSYDDRGRGTHTCRRLATPTAGNNAVIATRYAPRWYHQSTSYDSADRPVTETTGAQSSELKVNGQSSVTTTYTMRGTVASVESSYGTLVSKVVRDAAGLVGEIDFHDAASTTTVMKYDSRRRLSNVLTTRGGSVWNSPSASYQPPPAVGATDPPTSFQLALQDLDYSYDIVGNPTEIRDWRTPEEWPDGAKPVSRRMEYDDLYRVTRVDYEYPRGKDKWTSPFAAELNGVTDPRRSTLPMAHQNVPTRALWQTFSYDWLGNATQSDDDQHVYFDRSLGNITNGTAGVKPYQLTQTTPVPAGVKYGGGTATVNYDAAGALSEMRVQRPEGNCLGGACYTRFFYTWDEVGRLMTARRYTASNDVYVNYTYDANDERIRKTVDNGGLGAPGQYRDTLYIFDSLELRRTAWDSTSGEYPLSSTNEVAYLSAHGMRLGRVVYEPGAKGEPRSPSTNPLHVFLELPDHLGSPSIVLDYATSELVEARTYQAYGATESDYRPDRWKGFREDYGFTGKEEDVEVGLQYFGKRYLSPYLGRWISADPLAVHAPGEADLNLYAYVHGNLFNSIDPVGLADAPLPPVTEASDTKKADGTHEIVLNEVFVTNTGRVNIPEAAPPAAPQPPPPPPPIDFDLVPHVGPGPVSRASAQLFNQAARSRNGLERAVGYTLGCVAWCFSAYENVPRLVLNSPSNGVNMGQHLARASLNPDGLDAALDLLQAVESGSASASGMLTVGGVAADFLAPEPPTLAYRAVDPRYPLPARGESFYRSGAKGRLGSDGIYANSSVEGAIAEFNHHVPGIAPAVYQLKVPNLPRLRLDPPPIGYTKGTLPNTEGFGVLEAPSLRLEGSTNYLIRSGDVVGKRMQ
jgi:RHS repeat-associated protein